MSQRSYLEAIYWTSSQSQQKLEIQDPQQLPEKRKWQAALGWTEVRQSRSQAPPKVIQWGERFADLFYNRIGGLNDQDWIPERPLGSGGFGVVGLFQRKNERGEIIDRVVVKTTDVSRRQCLTEHLSKEAAVQMQLNDRDCHGLLFLRNFKHIIDSKQWRYYLEFAPYGDLERLRARYKAWGMYLPELFLWHCFDWLIKACVAMQQGPFLSIEHRSWNLPLPGTFILHSDIKTLNVLCGTTPSYHNTFLSDYPVPVIGDFGLSQMLTLTASGNLPQHLHDGTPSFMSPEQRYFLEKKPQSQWHPFLPRDPALVLNPIPGIDTRLLYRIGLEANLWCVGAVIYSILTLEERDVLSSILRNVLNENRPLEDGEHIIPEIQTKLSQDGREYSSGLRELVRDCLKFEPSFRPSLDEAQSRIRKGMRKHFKQLIDQCGDDQAAWEAATKVWCRDNEIRNVPPGPYRWYLPPHFFNEWTHREKWNDPDWGPCVIPSTHPSGPTSPAAHGTGNTLHEQRKPDEGRGRLESRIYRTQVLLADDHDQYPGVVASATPTVTSPGQNLFGSVPFLLFSRGR